ELGAEPRPEALAAPAGLHGELVDAKAPVRGADAAPGERQLPVDPARVLESGADRRLGDREPVVPLGGILELFAESPGVGAPEVVETHHHPVELTEGDAEHPRGERWVETHL